MFKHLDTFGSVIFCCSRLEDNTSTTFYRNPANGLSTASTTRRRPVDRPTARTGNVRYGTTQQTPTLRHKRLGAPQVPRRDIRVSCVFRRRTVL